jgi:hypothetical protein
MVINETECCHIEFFLVFFFFFHYFFSKAKAIFIINCCSCFNLILLTIFFFFARFIIKTVQTLTEPSLNDFFLLFDDGFFHLPFLSSLVAIFFLFFSFRFFSYYYYHYASSCFVVFCADVHSPVFVHPSILINFI